MIRGTVVHRDETSLHITHGKQPCPRDCCRAMQVVSRGRRAFNRKGFAAVGEEPDRAGDAIEKGHEAHTPGMLLLAKPQKRVGDRQEFFLSVSHLGERHGVCEAVGEALGRMCEFIVLTLGSWSALGNLLMMLVWISAPQFQQFPGVNNDDTPMLILVGGLVNAHEDLSSTS